jgi:hypothetical protein
MSDIPPNGFNALRSLYGCGVISLNFAGRMILGDYTFATASIVAAVVAAVAAGMILGGHTFCIVAKCLSAGYNRMQRCCQQHTRSEQL